MPTCRWQSRRRIQYRDLGRAAPWILRTGGGDRRLTATRRECRRGLRRRAGWRRHWGRLLELVARRIHFPVSPCPRSQGALVDRSPNGRRRYRGARVSRCGGAGECRRRCDHLAHARADPGHPDLESLSPCPTRAGRRGTHDVNGFWSAELSGDEHRVIAPKSLADLVIAASVRPH